MKILVRHWLKSFPILYLAFEKLEYCYECWSLSDLSNVQVLKQ